MTTTNYNSNFKINRNKSTFFASCPNPVNNNDENNSHSQQQQPQLLTPRKNFSFSFSTPLPSNSSTTTTNLYYHHNHHPYRMMNGIIVPNPQTFLDKNFSIKNQTFQHTTSEFSDNLFLSSHNNNNMMSTTTTNLNNFPLKDGHQCLVVSFSYQLLFLIILSFVLLLFSFSRIQFYLYSH